MLENNFEEARTILEHQMSEMSMEKGEKCAWSEDYHLILGHADVWLYATGSLSFSDDFTTDKSNRMNSGLYRASLYVHIICLYSAKCLKTHWTVLHNDQKHDKKKPQDPRQTQGRDILWTPDFSPTEHAFQLLEAKQPK